MSLSPGSLVRLSRASQYYLGKGFLYEEVPWMVSPEGDDHCRPEEREPFHLVIDAKMFRLPGSGEQGFIQMMLDGSLRPGLYQTTTPCFRAEPKLDDLHKRYFTKLELISYSRDGSQAAMDPFEMATVAASFYSELLSDRVSIEPVPHEWYRNGDRFDVMWRDIELGSYGVRCFVDKKTDAFHSWTYGTGCAEPRLGIAIARENVVKYQTGGVK